MADIRYVREVGTDNWLLVTLDDKSQVSLPYGLKVEVLSKEGKRERFKVLEGVNKGKIASVGLQADGGSWLDPAIAHLPAGVVKFDLDAQSLSFGGQGPFNAFSGGGFAGFTPVKPGSYALAIPAFPSKQTRAAYSRWTRFHKTWFRIGTDLSGSRFLHAGQISDGCVTVRAFAYDGKPETELPSQDFHDLRRMAAGPEHGLIGLPQPARPAPVLSYDKLYRYLILRRASDQSVGTLVVTGGGR